jgi:hypothetical protein
VEAISRKLYITPTDNRIRIRAEPVDGEPLTVVLLGQIVEVLTPYAEAIQCIGVEGEWLHVCTADGVEGYTAAWFYTVFDHAQMPDLDSLPLYVTPSDDLVRVRAQPGDGDPIDLVSRGDILTVLENQDEASSKLASEDQWLRIRTPNQVEGYVASQFLSAVEQPLPDWQLDANITGVNIDLYHPLGQPDPDDLGQMGWLRLPYNVSLNPDLPEGHPARYGNTDLDAAYQRYQPLIAHYAQAGFKILLTLTHQTYGEGAGYNWHRMNSDQWHDLGDQFAIMAGHIAAQYKGLVSAYQIWNEMDAPSEAHTAVPMPAADYAYLLFKSIQAIRAVDHTALVITGGHSGGPSSGVLYAMYTLNTMPRHVRPDGIAFHAFGRGDARSDAKFRSKGHIDDAVNAFAGIMPGYPVWITEWGVLDQPQETPEAVARYASEFIQRLKQTHSHKVAVAIWYAWAQGMGNGYGMVNERGKLRFDLAERFITL